MDEKKLNRMKNGNGFIGALDQSGGSTPKALMAYGISENAYQDEAQMFDLVHQMRGRIMASPSFQSDHILAVILFEQTMDGMVRGMMTPDYLWEKKGILSILKVDQGLQEEKDGVQLMKPMPDLDKLLDRAVVRNIFGTKMRSVIKEANLKGIEDVVAQQFEVGKQIIRRGLVPILEPEIDIHSPDKEKSETLMKLEILKHLESLNDNEVVMLKLSIPTQNNFFAELINHPKVLRVVALSGGYSREDAVKGLEKNPGLIASFSRALVEGLNVDQTEEEFNETLKKSVTEIYNASII